MDEGETIKQLRDLVEQLKRENELLKAKVAELESRLARYENAHTPPSLNVVVTIAKRIEMKVLRENQVKRRDIKA